eukprot:GFYU01006785.1.p1 GENE.GFYU01006785.1~~GFYU01006785.1.p1  ORF type:complete len:469 (+),score=23.15 GFYU01006785.1:68-1474(+)
MLQQSPSPSTASINTAHCDSNLKQTSPGRHPHPRLSPRNVDPGSTQLTLTADDKRWLQYIGVWEHRCYPRSKFDDEGNRLRPDTDSDDDPKHRPGFEDDIAVFSRGYRRHFPRNAAVYIWAFLLVSLFLSVSTLPKCQNVTDADYIETLEGAELQKLYPCILDTSTRCDVCMPVDSQQRWMVPSSKTNEPMRVERRDYDIQLKSGQTLCMCPYATTALNVTGHVVTGHSAVTSASCTTPETGGVCRKFPSVYRGGNGWRCGDNCYFDVTGYYWLLVANAIWMLLANSSVALMNRTVLSAHVLVMYTAGTVVRMSFILMCVLVYIEPTSTGPAQHDWTVLVPMVCITIQDVGLAVSAIHTRDWDYPYGCIIERRLGYRPVARPSFRNYDAAGPYHVGLLAIVRTGGVLRCYVALLPVFAVLAGVWPCLLVFELLWKHSGVDNVASELQECISHVDRAELIEIGHLVDMR